MTMSSGLLHFGVADPAVAPRMDRAGFRDSFEQCGLVEFRLDLSNLIQKEDDTRSMKLISDLELAYHRWHLLSTIPRRFKESLAAKLSPNSPNATFRSFANKISEDGDWTLKFSMDTEGESLTFRCDAGLDLFQFASARRFLANGAVMQFVQ